MSGSDDELAVRFSAALEAAGDVAYSWELDDDRLDWSGRLDATVLDLAAESATGRSFANRIHPDDLVHRQLALAGHFDGEGPFDCEYRLRDAEGGFVWVNERGRARRNGAGRPQVMLGVIRAIGDRKAQHITAAQPDAVATGNPGCLLQLRAALGRKGEKTPVLHTIQIVDASIRNERPLPLVTAP
jgi:PAS domain S-box-containing protein